MPHVVVVKEVADSAESVHVARFSRTEIARLVFVRVEVSSEDTNNEEGSEINNENQESEELARSLFSVFLKYFNDFPDEIF